MLRIKVLFVNITLSIDEQIAERARRAAGTMGKSLNQAVREYLEQLARADERLAAAAAFEASARATPGRLAGWHFSRDEANARG